MDKQTKRRSEKMLVNYQNKDIQRLTSKLSSSSKPDLGCAAS